MNKTFCIFNSILIFCSIFILSCDDMEDKIPDVNLPQTNETSSIFVLSEGLFNMNNSTLAKYNFKSNEFFPDYFSTINKRGLGDTAGDMARYGSKLYILVNISSQIEVIDINTGESLKQIPMFNEKGMERQPRHIAFYEGKAYVCSFDGTVARIDTTSLKVENYVNVGLNPDGICVANHKLYVSNSGGLNYPSYDKTVSVIDISTFREIKKINVGINPCTIHSDNEGDVYLVSRGNYGSEEYKFQRISSVTDSLVNSYNDIKALNFTIHNDTAYLYNYDFSNSDSWIKVFDCKLEKLISDKFVTDDTKIQTPYAIDVNPSNGDVYISDAFQFTVLGDVLCFDRNGKLKFRIKEIGLNPNKIIFN